ncbi:MAG: hypothetical protein ACYDHZ_08235 [Dehalococcoidia bacterium]
MKSFKHTLLIALVSFTGILMSCVNKEYSTTQNYVVTENRTEYVTESYTENETYMAVSSGEFELPSFNNWEWGNACYYGYDVPDADSYDNISLKIEIWKPPQYEPETITFLDVTKTGHLSYPDLPVEGEETSTENTQNYVITGTASNAWLKAANEWLQQSKFLGGKANLWSNQDNPQVMELDAGKAQKIGILIIGPVNKWNTTPKLFIKWTINYPVYGPVTKVRNVEKQVPYQVVKQRTYYEIKPVPIWETLLSAH